MALFLLSELIIKFEFRGNVVDDDDASNSLGGDVYFYFNKFCLESEKNKILKETLKEYTQSSDKSKEKLKEYETKFIFAYFLRHYHFKARHTISNKSNLREYILQNILTKEVMNKINEKTEKLLSDIRQSDANSNKYHSNCYEWSFKDAFLVELGHWFNNDFFVWYKPICRNDDCTKKGKMKYVKMEKDEELHKYGDEVARVHIYQCSECQTFEYFERFSVCDQNIKCAQYRRGFCGDHVDAFSAMVNALDYKWRFALDDTDHIWLEIYSVDRSKWCCFEPSPETDTKRYDFNKFANRKSRYIYSINATNEYEDVTHFYQTNKEILTKRRNQHCVSEEWIKAFIECEI